MFVLLSLHGHRWAEDETIVWASGGIKRDKEAIDKMRTALIRGQFFSFVHKPKHSDH